MNQLIFTDLGVIVGLKGVSRDAMQEIGHLIAAWTKGETKVLLLPLNDWEVLDRRTGSPQP